jgi:hypothetical protein
MVAEIAEPGRMKVGIVDHLDPRGVDAADHLEVLRRRLIL